MKMQTKKGIKIIIFSVLGFVVFIFLSIVGYFDYCLTVGTQTILKGITQNRLMSIHKGISKKEVIKILGPPIRKILNGNNIVYIEPCGILHAKWGTK